MKHSAKKLITSAIILGSCIFINQSYASELTASPVDIIGSFSEASDLNDVIFLEEEGFVSLDDYTSFDDNAPLSFGSPVSSASFSFDTLPEADEDPFASLDDISLPNSPDSLSSSQEDVLSSAFSLEEEDSGKEVFIGEGFTGESLIEELLMEELLTEEFPIEELPIEALPIEALPVEGDLISSGDVVALGDEGHDLLWSGEAVGLNIEESSLDPAAIRVTLSASSFVYNGKSQKPDVTVTDPSGLILDKAAYTVTYPSKSIDAGTYFITVTPVDPALSPAETQYVITKASQTVTTTSIIHLKRSVGDVPYQIEASITEGLVGGKLKYKSNNPNVATVDENGLITIVGTGCTSIMAYSNGNKNYAYANDKTYLYIRPERTDFVSVTNKKSILQMTWNGVDADRYHIQLSTDPEMKDHRTLTSTKLSYSKGSLVKGQTYYIRVRAIKTVNDRTFYGYWHEPIPYTML